MSSKASLYSGGYSSAAADRLNAVPLPDKVQCVQCRRQFMHAKFSQKQLSDYRQRILQGRQSTRLPRCRQCVGGPATELTCHRCELTKDLNAFTKVQRRKPDIACCKDCQQEVDDVEPNVEDALQEQEILETQTSIGAHSLYGYDSLGGSQAALQSRTGGSEVRSIASSAVTSENLMHFNKSSLAGASEDGVWTRQSPGGPRGSGSGSGGAKSGRVGAALPPIAASTTSQGNSSTGSDGLGLDGRGEQSYQALMGSAQSSTSGMSAKQGGNWVKQGKGKPDRGALREAEKQREAQRKVQEQERARFEEEGSSGSDWEL